MLTSLLKKCLHGETLTVEEARQAAEQIVSGNVHAVQTASLLSILHFRGETIAEMVGFTEVMREKMETVEYDREALLDTCGTGGDGKNTFNISTASAIVLSSLGIKVAKHGNRSVSSKSGSADVLEELGMRIQMSAEEARQALDHSRLCFLYAPSFHPGMKAVLNTRKQLRVRTIFNLLGPLLNPTQCRYQLIGLYDTKYAETVASVLDHVGVKRACIVTGADGLDECSITAPTDVVELNEGVIHRYCITPEDVGLSRGSMRDLQVDSVRESATIIQNILRNKAKPAQRDIVLFNAALALYVKGVVETVREGVELGKEALQSGRAYEHFFCVLRKETIHAANDR